jgi:hypothetical protein
MEFHILHSMHYNSIITLWTNKHTQFYSCHNITTHQLPHILGITGPSSGSTHLGKTEALCCLHVVAKNSSLCNIYVVDQVVHSNWRSFCSGFHGTVKPKIQSASHLQQSRTWSLLTALYAQQSLPFLSQLCWCPLSSETIATITKCTCSTVLPR